MVNIIAQADIGKNDIESVEGLVNFVKQSKRAGAKLRIVLDDQRMTAIAA
jgi:hypothetical protein